LTSAVRRRARAVAASGVLLLGGSSLAEAGPWALGPGRLFARLSYAHGRATTYAAPDGTEFPIPRFTTDDLDLSLAYGLGERATLYANLPVLRSSDLADSPDELVRESGIGDLSAGLEWALFRRGSWEFGLRGLVQAPTGDAERADGLQATGSGVFEGQLAFSAGTSFAAGRAYAVLEAGYQYRGEGFEDGVVFSGQVGWSVSARVTLAAGLRGVQPFRYPDGSVGTGALVGVGNGVTYVNYGPSLAVKLGGGVGLEFSVEGNFHTRNVTRGVQYRAGVTLNR
jgi:hypothetical protein